MKDRAYKEWVCDGKFSKTYFTVMYDVSNIEYLKTPFQLYTSDLCEHSICNPSLDQLKEIRDYLTELIDGVDYDIQR